MSDNTDTKQRLPKKYRGDIPLWNRVPYPYRSGFKRLFIYAVITFAAVVILFPIYWIVASSIRPFSTVAVSNPTLIPRELTIQHYIDLFQRTRFPRFLFNELVVAFGVVTITTTLATLGGYGLARINIPYKATFARGVLLGYMFPPILLGIPMYIMWSQIGLTNSYMGLILAITATSLPFALWLMWRFFLNVPYSLEEAARMCGATRFEALIHVAIPIAKPGIIACAVFAFAMSWADYTLALILMTDIEMHVLTTGIEAELLGRQPEWMSVMAGVSLGIIPPLIFVYYLQKYILVGFGGSDHL